MSSYTVRTDGDCVLVTQSRMFFALFGTLIFSGGCLGMYFLWRDSNMMTGTDFWGPLSICICTIIGGVYSISRPVWFEARFDAAQLLMAIRYSGFAKTCQRYYPYDEINGFSILESDSDGYWYSPMVALKGSELAFGFGFSAEEPARRFLEELIALLQTPTKTFELKLANPGKST